MVINYLTVTGAEFAIAVPSRRLCVNLASTGAFPRTDEEQGGLGTEMSGPTLAFEMAPGPPRMFPAAPVALPTAQSEQL